MTTVRFSSEQLTPEQAIAFHDSGAWKNMTARQRAVFQINQQCLCMPFGEFHKAVEEVLGRGVYTHEFALNYDGIRDELNGTGKAPTMQEIINMLPADKTIVAVIAP